MKRIYILPVIIMCLMPTVSKAEGEIRVVVKDIVTGNPISGAKVRAWAVNVEEEVTGLTTNSSGEVIVKRTDFTNSDVRGNHNYNVLVDITLTDVPGGYYIDDAFKGAYFGMGLTGQVEDPVVFELSKYIHFDVVSTDGTPIDLAEVKKSDNGILCMTYGGDGCDAQQRKYPNLTSDFTYLVTHDDYDTAQGRTRFDGGTVRVTLSPKDASVAKASADDEKPAVTDVEKLQAAEQQTDGTPTQDDVVTDEQGVESTDTTSSVATQEATASDTGNDRQRGQCTDTAKQTDPNVRYAKWQKKQGEYVCSITECVRGYEPNDAGTKCVAKMVLPEDKSAERINDLQGVYNEAKENEISDANKILGGASMGATGAGGMMLGMGLAEQKADNAAYEQMRGYVSTFKCNYGANNIEYSVEPTQLPTSTELTNLYAEYVTLANDLKMRKSVLGLRAGLESQPILDSATSGLYDDVSSGRAAGTFTSLARAILDPDGEDAKRWAEQTQKSKNLIIAGGVTAGVGVVGGIVGNVLINKDAPNLQSVREKIDYINKQYEEFYKEIDRIAEELDGRVYMEDDEKKREEKEKYMMEDYESEGGGDPTVTGDPEGDGDPTGNGDSKGDGDPTVTGDTEDDDTNLRNDDNGGETTERQDGINVEDFDGLPPGVQMITDNPVSTPTKIKLSIPGSTLFDLGKHDVKPGAKSHIEDLVGALSKLATETQTEFKDVITVTGYTDPVGGWNRNLSLSRDRANTVMNVITNKVKSLNNDYLTQTKTDKNTVGKGEAECTCAAGIDINNEAQVDERIRKYPQCDETTRERYEIDHLQSSQAQDKSTEFAPCRRVEIGIKLPEIPVNELSKYGLGMAGNSEISISDFIQKINNATNGTE